jgi:hypothetical protein
MLGDDQEEVGVDQSTGTTIWNVVYAGGVGVRVGELSILRVKKWLNVWKIFLSN